jgi:glycerol-3-phosphate dehydrogenase (NAD(P)+)
MIEATSRVVIAGYGQMGHAMESLLGKRAQLCIWPIAPDQLEPSEAIGHEAAAADFLLICTPTVAHTAVLDRLAHRLPPECAALSIAKGLDSTGRCAADILHSYCGKRPWGVLGGPMIANEIIAGKPAFAALGTHDKALLPRAQELFPRQGLVMVGTPNPQAVSWCGVLKNIYAPLVGISDELNWGDNARGYIIMAALREMRAILGELTGDDDQAYGDAGLADFITTVTSPSSHHYALGRRVARGDFGNMECEGVHSLRVLLAGDRVAPDRHPLLGIASHLIGEYDRLPQVLHGWLSHS